MKHNLLVIVIALAGLSCPAWGDAAAYGSGSANTYLVCNFNALANGQPTVYQMKVDEFRTFLGGMAGRLSGFNMTNGAFLDGKVIQRSNGSWFINYDEFPNISAQAQQTRRAYVDIPATLNYPWLGFVLDYTLSGNFKGQLNFTAGTCQSFAGTTLIDFGLSGTFQAPLIVISATRSPVPNFTPAPCW